MNVTKYGLSFLLTALCVQFGHGCEVCPNDSLCSLYNSMERLLLCPCCISKPHSKAICQDSLYKSSVGMSKRAHPKPSLLQKPDKIQSFLSFLHCGDSVCTPAQVRCQLQAQEFVAVSPLHHSALDGEWLQKRAFLPKVYYELSGLVYIEEQVIFLSIDHDVIDQFPIPCLISPLNKAQDGHVICIFNDE